MHKYVYIYICIYICINMYIYICINMYIYICIYICINMYDDIIYTGRYSELGGSILYVVRLAVRVEGYLKFLVRIFTVMYMTYIHLLYIDVHIRYSTMLMHIIIDSVYTMLYVTKLYMCTYTVLYITILHYVVYEYRLKTVITASSRRTANIL